MAALTTAVRASRQRVGPALSQYSGCRYGSTDIYRDQASNLTAYKRGRGGRSSFSGLVTTVFGASGFLGRYIAARLGRVGSQIIVPYRADAYDVFHLSLCGDLGQVKFLPFHLMDDDSIRKAMQYSNVVINLIGRDWPTKRFSLEQVHIEGAARIAKLAKEMGVEKFVHMSHLNAQPNPPSICIKGGSQFLRCKHEGEQAVRSYFPEAIIFRPSDIYGLEDRFVKYYASRHRRLRGNIPLWKKGEETVKMPVHISDVTEGIISALENPDAPGTTYEAIGPDKFRLNELITYMYRCMRADDFRITHLTPEFKAWVKLLEKMPVRPPLQWDRLATEHTSDQTQYLPTLEDLGVKLTKVEDRFPYVLKPHQYYGYYEEKFGEFAAPPPPQPVP